MEGNPPTPSVSPERVEFGGINGSSSDDSRTSSDSSNSSNNNDSGDLSALMGRPARDLEGFGEHFTLESGRTRSGSRGLTVILRECPAGVCPEDRGSQEDRVGEGRGNRTSSRFTAG